MRLGLGSHFQLNIRSPEYEYVSGIWSVTFFNTCCTFEPSAFITKISHLPFRSERNMICFPSGDHTGATLLGCAKSRLSICVNKCRFDPSVFTIPICHVGCCAIIITICFPSGENCGERIFNGSYEPTPGRKSPTNGSSDGSSSGDVFTNPSVVSLYTIKFGSLLHVGVNAWSVVGRSL